MTPPIVLTIAAHDPLGGAGLAADLTTFATLGVHGTVAVTAITAQRFGAVDSVTPTPAANLAAQIEGVLASYPIAGVKIGLLADADQVDVVAGLVAAGALPAPIIDPVMVDGRGRRFVAEEVEVASRELLFPHAAALTPNHAEAELLGGTPEALAGLGADLVVVTGGRTDGRDQLVWPGGATEWIDGPWISTDNVRGSGCTFAAALAAAVAQGHAVDEAARRAKTFVSDRLRASAKWDFGDATEKVVGPVAHTFPVP